MALPAIKKDRRSNGRMFYGRMQAARSASTISRSTTLPARYSAACRSTRQRDRRDVPALKAGRIAFIEVKGEKGRLSPEPTLFKVHDVRAPVKNLALDGPEIPIAMQVADDRQVIAVEPDHTNLAAAFIIVALRRMQWLVQVPAEMNDKYKRFTANSLRLVSVDECIAQTTERRDYAIPPRPWFAMFGRDISGRADRNVDEMPARGFRPK